MSNINHILKKQGGFMTTFITLSTISLVIGVMILSLIKVWISTSNNPDNP